MADKKNKNKKLAEGVFSHAIKGGLPSTVVRKGFSRLVGHSIPHAKGFAVNVGVGVGLEAGMHAHERNRKNKERAMRRIEAEGGGEQMQETLELSSPPVVLVLKRKSVRLFPDGQRIALYHNAKLDINFAVPYENSDDGHHSNKDTIGAMSEGVPPRASMFNQAKKLFKAFISTKAEKSKAQQKVDWETWQRYQKRAQRDAARAKKAQQHYNPQEVKKAKGSVKAEIGAALVSGVATSSFIDKARHHLERPNRKHHGGSYVYESPVRMKTGAFSKVPHQLRFGSALGLAAGGSLIALDVAREVSTAEKESRKRNKRMKNKKVVQEMARRPNSKIPKMRMKKLLPWRGALIGAAAGVALGAAVRHHRNEETEQINEFLPAIGAAIAGAAGRITLGGVARFVGGQVAANYAIDKTMKVGKTIANKVAKKQAGNEVAQQGERNVRPPTISNNPAKVNMNRDENSGDEMDESLMSRSLDEAAKRTKKKASMKKKTTAKLKTAEVKLKKTFVPAGLGKEITKGAAVALGTALATKAIDIWYDHHRDKVEVEKAAKTARAEAKAKHEVAPRKVEVQTKKNPHTGVVVTKRKIVEHIDGTSSEIRDDVIDAIEALFEQLNDENRTVMLNVMSESRDGLEKISEFAMNQYLSEGQE